MRATMLIPLVALWALVLVPAACPVGLVAHGCAEDLDSACGHEDVCQTDPCNVARLPHDDADLGLMAATAGAAVAALPVSVPVPAAPAVPCAPAALLDPPDLPAPPATLPLLC